MPIFDYACDCGYKKEDNYVTKSDEVVICPMCEAVMVKLITGGYKIRPDGAENLRCGKRYT